MSVPLFESVLMKSTDGCCDSESAGKHGSGRPLRFLEGEVFGRRDEANQLIAAYERRISSSERELVLLTGASGTGKTRLAQQLREHVETDGGMLITGKFDQLQSPKPFSAFVAAFTDFSQQLLLKGEPALSWVRKRVYESEDIDTKLLTDMIPALLTILDEMPTGSDSTGDEPTMQLLSELQKQRFLGVFAKFLSVMCSPEYPCVLFLDDLQWADVGSLALLNTLVSNDRNGQGAMILGACRGNEVQINDPLAEMLRSLEDDSGVRITNIMLTNLSQQSVNELVAVSLDLDNETCQTLSDVAFQLTNGNIFYTKQYLQSLYADGIIFFDETTGSKGHWTWDELQLQKSALTTKELLAKAIQDLPPVYQNLLKIASSLGAVSAVDTLCFLVPRDVVEKGIEEAMMRGILVPVPGTYDLVQFAHDQIQRASYDLIGNGEKKEFHLSIARALTERLSDEEFQSGDILYLVVGQFAFGYGLIHDAEERHTVANLCLKAGQKAIGASAFNTASSYFMLGINVLGERCWRDHYAVCLLLHNAAAEISYCNADIVEMEVFVDAILRHARTYHDKITAYCTKILSLGSSMKLQEALDVGLNVLKKLGEPLPSPTKYNILREYVKTKWKLRGKSNKDILKLPLMSDREKLGAMRISGIIFLYACFFRPEYFAILATKSVQLTLKYGLSAMSAPGFASYAVLLCSGIGSMAEGYKSGQLSLLILEKFKSKEWVPRVYSPVYGIVLYWREPVQVCLQPLLDSYKIGLSTGDVEFACFSAVFYSLNSLYAGRPLPKLVEEMTMFRETMLTLKQSAILAMLTSTLQMCSNFLGRSDNPLILSGEFMIEAEQLIQIRESKNGAAESFLDLSRAWLALCIGNLDQTETYTPETRKNTAKFMRFSFGRTHQYFLDGMAAVVAARATGVRANRIRTVRHSAKQLRRLAYAAPSNFLHSVCLLDAEIAGWNGNLEDAKVKYQRSIDMAAKGKYLAHLGLSHERLAYTLREHGEQAEALQNYIKSRDAFEEWGAKIKVDQLNKTITEFSP
jgi:histidine kinase